MFKLGNLVIPKGLFLAPMEDVTDISFRLMCRQTGADFVFTEFVNAEGLVRSSKKTHTKLEICNEERPVGIQIYGGKLESMIGAARIAEQHNPDVIDINAGCWVKNVVGSGAGAALLKDPEMLQRMVEAVVKSVSFPVSVKTRIGWDTDNIVIEEVAKRLEDVGIAFLTVHCRTRMQAHNGDADWDWIERVKNKVSIPVILNGGIMQAEDAMRAFRETPADAVMIARGAINNPWIFEQTKTLMNGGTLQEIDIDKRISYCLDYLKLSIGVKGERRAVLENRKFYSAYLKGSRNASHYRAELMKYETYAGVEDCLRKYQEFLADYDVQQSLGEVIPGEPR